MSDECIDVTVWKKFYHTVAEYNGKEKREGVRKVFYKHYCTYKKQCIMAFYTTLKTVSYYLLGTYQRQVATSSHNNVSSVVPALRVIISRAVLKSCRSWSDKMTTSS